LLQYVSPIYYKLLTHISSELLKFDATFDEGGGDAVEKSLLNCAIIAGLGTNTEVHGVGDGVSWIESQMKEKFKSKAIYLIDFYHVGKYLAETDVTCSANDPSWLDTQKACYILEKTTHF